MRANDTATSSHPNAIQSNRRPSCALRLNATDVRHVMSDWSDASDATFCSPLTRVRVRARAHRGLSESPVISVRTVMLVFREVGMPSG